MSWKRGVFYPVFGRFTIFNGKRPSENLKPMFSDGLFMVVSNYSAISSSLKPGKSAKPRSRTIWQKLSR